MRNIRMEKEIILYYGNPAGYVIGGKAVVDPLFESEKLNDFLSRQKDIGEVKWTDGVYDRLVNGQKDTQEITLLKSQLRGKPEARIGYPDAVHQPWGFLQDLWRTADVRLPNRL